MSVRTLRTSLQRIANLSTVVLTALASFALLVVPILPGERALNIRLGDVSPQDVLATRSIVYVSAVLTREAREQAIQQVNPVYDPPDPRIARQQAESLHSALAFISNERSDVYSSPDQKVQDLKALNKLQLDSATAANLLQLSDLDWKLIQGESETVLEQVMRQQIRPDRLEDVRSSLPAYISLNLSEEQAGLVTNIVSPLIVPNSLYNAIETKNLQEQAASSVIPVTRSFVPGQVVIGRGHVVNDADMEAVDTLGLTTGMLNIRTIGSMALAIGLITLILVLFLQQFHPEVGRSFRYVLLQCVLYLLFVGGARLMTPGHTVLPYIFPIAALAITNSAFIGAGYGILSGVLLAAITSLLGGNQLEIALYGGLGSVIGVLTMGKGEKPLRFLAAGFTTFLAGIATVCIIRLREPATDLVGILTLTGASLANGVLTGSLALGLLFVAGNIFDITTNMQLLELTRPDHPLLRLLLRDAPGTYQHSLQVANLAEAAGERTDTNTLLLRVGALFHDCGKTMRPKFFVENQGPDGNPHDHLDPESSAKLIIQHTRDGMDLARKYRLPTSVRNLIPEHHGTLRTNYQYGLALKAASGEPSQVEEMHFRYPGPRPQSKEAAILMLADGAEAKFRALRPTSIEEIETLVRNVIDERIAQRQFDETNLTLKDIDNICMAFIETLKGSIHPRLLYPEDEAKHAEDRTPTI